MVATVQKPAPAFTATAVVDSQFKDISLSDFLGQWCVALDRVLMPVQPAHTPDTLGLCSSSTLCKSRWQSDECVAR